MDKTTFTQKQLILKIELAHGSFTDNPADNVFTIKGLRIHAEIKTAPMSCGTQAQIIVYGLKTRTMNAVSQLRGLGKLFENKVTLTTIDEQGKEALVFEGMIMQALADYNQQPKIPFYIFARDTVPLSLAKAKPVALKGSHSVVEIVQAVIDSYNSGVKEEYNKYVIEDNGVSAVLSNVSLDGSFYGMLNKIQADANISIQIEGRTVILIPKGEFYRKIAEITISKDNGLIGYPTLAPNTCFIKCYYSPFYRYRAPITLKSEIVNFQDDLAQNVGKEKLEQRFVIQQMTHKLQSETPGGLWQSELRMMYLNEPKKESK